MFLVLRLDALGIPDLDGPIRWANLADVDLRTTNNRVTLRLLLAPHAPTMRRLAGACRVRLDAGPGIVTVAAVLPRPMRPHDLAALVARYRRAAEARRLLADSEAAALQAGDERAAPAAPMEPPRPSCLPARRQTS